MRAISPLRISQLGAYSSRVIASLTALGLASPVRASAQSAAHAAERRVIDSLVTDAVAAHRLASVAVAVIQGNATITLRAAGLADPLATPRAASPRTVYRLGSITKQFTAAIVLQLAQERRLSLSDTLGRFLPWVPATWRGVTIAQLLNHTSGLPSYTNIGAAWRSRATEALSADTLIALAFSTPVDFAPGSQWKYNNGGYVILGRIIELVDRRSYATAVLKRLAGPLGLASLRYCTDDVASRDNAVGSQRASRDTFQPSAPLSLTQPFSAGALCANVLDVVRWNRALHGGRVMNAANYARMTTPDGAARAAHYGFGIGRDTVEGRLRLLHSGAVNGFSSSNSFWPDSALTIAVLSNTDGNDVDAIAEQIQRVLLHRPLQQRPTAIALGIEQLDAHVGQFEIALPGRTLGLVIQRRGTQLTATFAGDTPNEIVPIGAHRFMALDDDNLQFEFQFAGDSLTALVLHSGPQTFTGRRIRSAP